MSTGKRIVIALGGNAILQPGQAGSFAEQLANVQVTADQIADLVAAGHTVIVTHGNGPQVGAILIQQEAGRAQVPAMPLDACGAQSQGLIGYMLQQCLGKSLRTRGIERPVATIVTQAVVNPDDPAFQHPTKPVGPFYNEDWAKQRMASTDERWIEDAGRGWRRVVASPNPQRIVEAQAVARLVETGAIVIVNGGGGIPVIEKDGDFVGVEAVIDKDLGAERVAHDVRAEVLMILTDVPRAAINYRTPQQRELDRVSLAEVEKYQQEGHFKAGSMGPKVEACRRFVANGGETAIIASLTQAVEAIAGRAGTHITR
ncbi:MAG: Carbamate kinase 2 [Firmicutes bacterium ADurb.Bin506]|nr:MAG: Carbamate kinase 2 [Firmicutes bacterium ADurb.Bin506]